MSIRGWTDGRQHIKGRAPRHGSWRRWAGTPESIVRPAVGAMDARTSTAARRAAESRVVVSAGCCAEGAASHCPQRMCTTPVNVSTSTGSPPAPMAAGRAASKGPRPVPHDSTRTRADVAKRVMSPRGGSSS